MPSLFAFRCQGKASVSLGQSNTTTGYRQMVQQTSSSWYLPHWHHNSFPQLAVVTGFTSAKLACGSSFLSSSLQVPKVCPNRSSSALLLVATVPTFLIDASMHNVPSKGLLNSYRHCNPTLQKPRPRFKICSFQEVFVCHSSQQPKVIVQT